MQAIDDELMRRIRNDLIDSYDEELEMELEDRTAAELTGLKRQPTVRKTKKIAAFTFVSCFACRASWSSCKTGSKTPATRW